MEWHAQWIWLDNKHRRPRNQMVIARKTLYLPVCTAATLAITAVTQYRLFINGQWIEDGPCRSWSRHHAYDLIDVTPYLRLGRNVIAVQACHFGVSTFRQTAQEAGLLAQLDVTTAYGDQLRFGTDPSWLVQEDPAHARDTARIGVAMEQAEWYDATLAIDSATGLDCADTAWPLARGIYDADKGPWRDLHPRDTRFLTREPVFPRRVVESRLVRGCAETVTFDLKRLCYPLDRSANRVPILGVLATVLESDSEQAVPITVYPSDDVTLYCRGEVVSDGVLELVAGENLLTVVVLHYGHMYDLSLGFQRWEGITTRNPCDPDYENPWSWIGPFAPLEPVTNIEHTLHNPVPERTAEHLHRIGVTQSAAEFSNTVAYRPVPPGQMLLRDSYLAFRTREVLGSADALIRDRGALLADNQEWTTVEPPLDGDVEICLDLGKEVVGWVEFVVNAPAGTVVDAYLLEYRAGEHLQFTDGNRNGLRYVCRDGVNHFVSLKRRAGRYLFLTLRRMTAPVRIRTVRVVQATYPVEQRGAFQCSDLVLNRIWEISAYTLRLCMEDVLTNCPLYEQALWASDARNASRYALICYGAEDLVLRSLRLTAPALETPALASSQAPGGWNITQPVGSFLWVINVWEYYFATGDRDGMAELYPAVMHNLRVARARCTDHGLFSMPAWHAFDATKSDNGYRTVLHNALFLVGALDAALQCCRALGKDDLAWLHAFRTELATAIRARWSTTAGSYPDAVDDDGNNSPTTSQHTSALALLYGVLPLGVEEVADANLIAPREGMARVGSPFALQFLLEALEKQGHASYALRLLRARWQHMLECGATTCWETFRGWDAQFPTHSHCHAWSAVPIDAFTRLILGIIPTAVGMAEVTVSPHPHSLEWAEGACYSPHGDLHVAWRKIDATLSLTIHMPPAVIWTVVPNSDWQDITRVIVNGKEQAELVGEMAGV